MHARAVDTRPFLSGWEGPGYEARSYVLYYVVCAYMQYTKGVDKFVRVAGGVGCKHEV